MTKSPTTKEKLVTVARQMFWARGFSNVSVRDITGAVGCDAALVSRYFGGKEGLFEATLETLPDWDALSAPREDVLELAVATFTRAAKGHEPQASPFNMLLANVIDPVMAPRIRKIVQEDIADRLAAVLGGEAAAKQAAMLLAVLFGMSLMRKNFQLAALTDLEPEQLRALVTPVAAAALRD
jgi:AcrR family transcriptional regulator